MKHNISNFIDIFYPPFRRIMPIETYRYAACGGINTLLGLFNYYISYHYIFNKVVFDLGFFAFKPHMAALFFSGIISFLLGFLLNKYVVFTGSNLKGRIQLFRYFLSFAFNLFFNYLMLKFLVEFMGQPAFFSQLITTVLVIAISYFSQKYFTFKVK
ncbi:MAG: GtrA family protein [Bacteroidota bacterium]